MFDKYEAQKLLYTEILATAKGNYAELLQAWSALDQKATNSITISGIFLAAAFSFIKELIKNKSFLERSAVVLVVVLLISAVALSLLALWTRKTEVAHRSTIIRDHVYRVFQLDSGDESEKDELLRVSLVALNTFSKEWDVSSESVSKQLAAKGDFVKLSQIFLFVALLLVSGSIVLKIMFVG